ncbi:hypothetical protein GCM10025785_13580 [Corynebacterium canis]
MASKFTVRNETAYRANRRALATTAGWLNALVRSLEYVSDSLWSVFTFGESNAVAWKGLC